ncbi:hypothetical protein [Ekhidna sp.]|uniref:hypothetical protein n=1 Tax=Ekhidna sp. TaxID=2608089 RepID=UPI003B5CB643
MIKKLTTILFVSLFTIQSCVAQKSNEQYGELKGTIGIYEGNCMPGPGIPPCEPRPISNTVLITELSKDFQPELLIDSVRSDKNGSYTIILRAGTYSLFLRDGDSVVCDVLQCPDQCYCQPFKIVADSTTVVDANLDHATW